MHRRSFIKLLSAFGALAAGLLSPIPLFAGWSKAAFEARSLDRALKDIYGTGDCTDSNQIELDIPPSIRNGALVPVSITTALEQVEAISILVESNPWALAAHFPINPGQVAYASTRIKVAMDSKVFAVIKANGGLYRIEKSIRVLEGGCVTS